MVFVYISYNYSRAIDEICFRKNCTWNAERGTSTIGGYLKVNNKQGPETYPNSLRPEALIRRVSGPWLVGQFQMSAYGYTFKIRQPSLSQLYIVSKVEKYQTGHH